MKLKDKKIDIMGVQYVSDKYGNRKKETVTLATVWAYSRQFSGGRDIQDNDADGRNRYVSYQLPFRHNNVARHKVQRYTV